MTRKHNRRLRRALARHQVAEACYRFEQWQIRKRKFQAGLDAYAATLFAREGRVHPFSIGAVLASKGE